jgi:hypothetical protein
MQHLPFYSLEDFERSRVEMQAFRENLNKDKHVWPDLTLSGEDIHRAFCVVMPDDACAWSEIPEIAKMQYNDMAKELNRELDARRAWFEGDSREISAIKCPSCGAMLTNLKGHPCLTTS